MKIPKPTIKRLAVYYRCLDNMLNEGKTYVSSKELAERLKIKSSQVRKDLSYFGEFGKRGVGYNVKNLTVELKKIIGIDRRWRVVVVGAGNIGRAITNYPGLYKNRFDVIAVFDSDPAKIGFSAGVAGPVKPMSDLKEVVSSKKVEIGVIAVPAEAAQDVAEQLVDAGVKGIVNFAPVTIDVPPEIAVEDVDITVSFKTLAYHLRKYGKYR